MIGEDDQGTQHGSKHHYWSFGATFVFTNILVSLLFLGQDLRGAYAPFGVVNDRRG